MINREWMIDLLSRRIDQADIDMMQKFSGLEVMILDAPHDSFLGRYVLENATRVSVLINLCFDKIREQENAQSRNG